LLVHFLDALVDQVCNFTAHNLRDFAAFLPVHIGGPLLPLLAVGAHVQLEVLVNQKAQELPLLRTERTVGLGGLVKHDVSHLGLDFLAPKHVFLSKLNRVLGVVLKLNLVFVFLVSRLASERVGDLFVPLLLPTSCVAIQGLAVGDRLANNLHPSKSALAVVAHFGLTWSLWALFVRVAISLALVLALLPLVVAFLSTAVFEQ
jgi:hypothetical protein